MSTRGLQSWRDLAAADWMLSKPKLHRRRRTFSQRARQNLRVGKTRIYSYNGRLIGNHIRAFGATNFVTQLFIKNRLLAELAV